MQADVRGEPCGTPDVVVVAQPVSSLEARYLRLCVLDDAPLALRLAASLLAIRACFFTTSYEASRLAADTGIRVLHALGDDYDREAILAAWDELDDPTFDVPMIELSRADITDPVNLHALLLLHIAVTQSFTGLSDLALETLAEGMKLNVSAEMVSDLHMYRGVILSKRMKNTSAARAEITLGLAALGNAESPEAKVREAWLRNLAALTWFQENDLARAHHEEALAIAAIDDVPGASATHLKTNLVSNFSVVFEVQGDFATAIKIWSSFETLNKKLGSARADKVYFNRLGALQLKNGDVSGALESFQTAFRRAEHANDTFHGEIIAATIARIYLGAEANDPVLSQHWYGRAMQMARAAGDSLQVAALATEDASSGGLALTQGKTKMSRPFDLVNL